MSFAADDRHHMARALELAQRGLYTTTPNPRVGCVLVKGGIVIAEGWHERAGGPHAEAMALQKLGARGTGPGAAQGATAYVTLEPCSHHGRTPPCADALIAAGVARVVAAMRDPNPLVAGQGLARIAAAGIAVECGLLEDAARELNPGFISRMTRGRPWLRLKIAASLDGRTALANGVSQWITGPEARTHAQHWRARSCAMLTGIGTVLADNPRLNVRAIETPRQPWRVVLDSQLRTPPDAAILAGGGALIATAHDEIEPRTSLEAAGAEIFVCAGAQGRVDLPALLTELARRGCNEVMAECGPRLAGALLDAGLVDELLIYQAPLILGSDARGMADLIPRTALDQAIRIAVVERAMLGDDSFLRGRV